jgi:ketosteroid isomerase-like protein
MSQDIHDVRATLSALNAACAARDLGAFMALFDDSDEILFVGSDKGELFRGREATRAFMQTLYGLPFVFSFDLGEVVIRQDGGHAWIFVDGKMVRTADRGAAVGKVGESPYRFSITMVKRDDRWRWQLFHGSVPGTE